MREYLLNILFLSAIGFVLMFWWRTLDAKAVALRAAKARCDEFSLQLLDESVVFSGARMTRLRGKIAFRRRFRFEFSSTGAERYSGSVTVLGGRPVNIEMDAHRLG